MATREMQSQLEHLQMKHVGTGHADITKYEWLVNQHRDSYASYVRHPNLLAFFSIAENLPMARLRSRYLEKIVDPCGPPPTPQTTEPPK